MSDELKENTNEANHGLKKVQSVLPREGKGNTNPSGVQTGQGSPESASEATPPTLSKPIPPKPKITGSPERKAKQDRPADRDAGIWRMNRRNFLNVAGWMAFLTFIVTSVIGTLRYMFPRVLFEPPTKFKVGFPSDFVMGEISESFKDKHRVWIVREKEGFYALVAICTHLGCTPNWMASEDKFKCPCHGSGYYRNGVNFEGPTPRPLERAYIALADDGQIVVDTSIKFRYEFGQWANPGSYFKYTGA